MFSTVGIELNKTKNPALESSSVIGLMPPLLIVLLHMTGADHYPLECHPESEFLCWCCVSVIRSKVKQTTAGVNLKFKWEDYSSKDQ